MQTLFWLKKKKIMIVMSLFAKYICSCDSSTSLEIPSIFLKPPSLNFLLIYSILAHIEKSFR